VNISVSTSRMSVEQLVEDYLPQLLESTSMISGDLSLLRRRRTYE